MFQEMQLHQTGSPAPRLALAGPEPKYCSKHFCLNIKVLTFYVLCLEIMYVMISRYTKKTELN